MESVICDGLMSSTPLCRDIPADAREVRPFAGVEVLNPTHTKGGQRLRVARKRHDQQFIPRRIVNPVRLAND